MLQHKTPYEVLLNKKHDYQFLRVFGCLAMASNPDRTADKFSPRGVPCLFLGYPRHQKGYKLYNLLTKTKFVSRDVQFHEDFFLYSQHHMLKLLNPLPSPSPQSTHWYNDYVTTTALNVATQVQPIVMELVRKTASSSNSHMPAAPTTEQLHHHKFLHLKAFMTALLSQTTHTSFKKAIQDKEWCLAMNDELRALELNGTWEITHLPPSKKPIDYHWIFKTKLKADVAKMVTVRALLVVAAMNNWDICQMDVSNAFLHGDIFEDVYMKIPMGYTGEGETVQDIPRSNKSFGYVQSKVDYSLFTKKDNTSFIFVMVYVDDLIITLVSLLKDLGIKDLGPVDLKCDNQAAIYIAANSIFHARIKHIEVDCQYVRDQVKAGTVKPSYVSSKAQVADVFTKRSIEVVSLNKSRGL
ncbi:retrovirus-related pol polyprotein from transposon TNT 1-94 [Tanacetum coccineum]|uniref:Retrovirus-related pol polyprotein from transposon TNT 1-94 n=1 Tax=Tanacetum coccineum TaxID=301880 RepID=A0ABQ5GL57_9ASTR